MKLIKSTTFSATASKYIILLLAVIGFILLSPKWTIALAAWIAPALLLWFIRQVKPMKGFLFGPVPYSFLPLLLNMK